MISVTWYVDSTNKVWDISCTKSYHLKISFLSFYVLFKDAHTDWSCNGKKLIRKNWLLYTLYIHTTVHAL